MQAGKIHMAAYYDVTWHPPYASWKAVVHGWLVPA
jgi:hypothetical protein